ncbi:hypothetical protein [Bacillus kexueae]|uniref:hypothetical protein n=1 Tax=Aeribacillus kexueae TaxID=2078952 RepID=UPI001FAEB6F9|nr:hypothetical protein [Bacillus kexueae]
MKGKPIKGSQILPPLTPNNLMEECIRVQKVYDWVVDSNRYTNKVPLPGGELGCAASVREAIEAGDTLRIEVITPDVPGTFPLIPKPQPDQKQTARADVVEVVNGEPGEPGRVRVIWTVIVTVQVWNDTSADMLCEFDVPVQFDEDYAVCIPEPLDESNVLCRMTKIVARPTNRVFLGNMVELTIFICTEMQVEAEVKLEVLAKFCQPRPNDIVIPTPPEEECPLFEFPPQCPDIFPRQNCDCQAAADATTENQTVTFSSGAEVGDVSLTAQICNNCTLSQSSWIFNFTDTNGYLYADQSFTATPLSFTGVTCNDTTPGFIEMVLTGVANMSSTATGTSINVTYSLRLRENDLLGGTDEYQLILTDPLGNIIFNSNPVTVPNADLEVRDCRTFND